MDVAYFTWQKREQYEKIEMKILTMNDVCQTLSNVESMCVIKLRSNT